MIASNSRGSFGTGTDADVARIIGALLVTGTAQSTWADRLRSIDVVTLSSMTPAQLAAELGCSRVRAHRVVLAFELHRRLLAAQVPQRPNCSEPDTVAALMRPYALADTERLWALPLDARCRMIGGEPLEIYRGDVDGTDAGPRAVVRSGLRAGATALIICHNHPSGDPSPSAADVAVTRRIIAAGKAVDVPLVDHVVIAADGRWCSLRRDQPDIWRS